MLSLSKAGAWTLLILFFGVGGGKRLEAAVTASSLAIVGYDDFHDTFSMLALSPLSAGETIYFTNNGWSSTQGKFNGADASQGAGNESLIKLTLTQTSPKAPSSSPARTGQAGNGRNPVSSPARSVEQPSSAISPSITNPTRSTPSKAPPQIRC